jgi:AbrB family looped-hinge helix DNA binding protein
VPNATLTSKGQVTIPVEVRRKLGLKTGDRIEFRVRGAEAAVSKSALRPARSLYGLLRREGQRALSVEEMNAAVARHHRKAR